MPSSPFRGPGADAPPTMDRRVLAFSTDRTLALVRPVEGLPRVRKIFESGADADAQREQRLAEILHGPGIVRVLDRGRDPDAADRPFLDFPALDGSDLAALLRSKGPFDLADTLSIAHELATILQRIGNLRTEQTPSGWVHRDVKPSNILVRRDRKPGERVVLLDLEHATPADTAPLAASTELSGTRFTGGTPAYSPPEALGDDGGRSPNSAFDVYGFGLTIRALLRGLEATTTPRFVDRVIDTFVPENVLDLIRECSAPIASARPDWSSILDRLAAAQQVAKEKQVAADANTIDRLRIAVLRGDTQSARDIVESCRADPMPGHELPANTDEILERAQTLETQLLAARSQALASGGSHLARRTRLTLDRFPGHAESITARDKLLRAGVQELQEGPNRVQTALDAGDFETAETALNTLAHTQEQLTHLGPLPVDAIPSEIPQVLRHGVRVQQLLQREFDSRLQRHLDLMVRLETAESTVDLAQVRESMQHISLAYGGTSAITARLKARLHGYEFAISRIAGSSDAVDECLRQLEIEGIHLDLRPLQQLIETCTSSTPEARATNCRNLAQILDELVTEHPHTEGALAAPRAALMTTLETLTKSAWETLETSKTMLTASPIPIRPLGANVHRIDRLDISGVLIDLEGRTRTQLLDTLESLRTHVDRARVTRDRLAQGAEQALEQGHLTTALFEMERVAREYDDDTASIGSPRGNRYEEAKQLREHIRQAQETNHATAASYREAVASDAPDDTAATRARIEILREREQALDFLCRNVTEERRPRYGADLNRLRFQLFEEAASAGTSRYAESEGSTSQSEVAAQITRELALLVPANGWNTTQLSEARDAIERFRDLGARSKKVQQRSAAHAGTGPARRPWLAVAAAAAALIAATGLGWTLWQTAKPTYAAELPRRAGELQSMVQWPETTRELDESQNRLESFARELVLQIDADNPALRNATRRLLDTTLSFGSVRVTTSTEADAEWARLSTTLSDFEAAAATQIALPANALDRFAQAAHALAAVHGIRRGGEFRATFRQHVVRCEGLRSALPDDFVTELAERDP